MARRAARRFFWICAQAAAYRRVSSRPVTGNSATPYPHPEGALVAEQPGLNCQPVQRPRHDLEGAQAALCRPLTEGRVHGEELEEIAGGHGFGHRIVKDRAFRRKAVGAVRFELVGEIPAGHKDGAAAQSLHRLGHTLSQTIVVQR